MLLIRALEPIDGMLDVVSSGVHITELIRRAISPFMLGYGLFAICFTSTPQRIEC
jgi:hypothetical protein